MNRNPASEIDPLDPLAEEFVDRLRRGERPTVEEYAVRLPQAADRIRELFPALAAMEEAAAALTGGGTGSAPTEADSAPRPERIGDYRILREVGRGGMGVVYEAEQESLGRHVALKVLLPEYQTRARFLERFRREARAAGRLHHTNIVPVFGVGESDGTHYYVMQYIAGVGLDQVIRDVRRLRRDAGRRTDPAPPTAAEETLSVAAAEGLLRGTPDDAPRSGAPAIAPGADSSQLGRGGGYYRAAARLALQAARALDHAHAHGVVHRDIKPSNFLLDAEDNLWVTDFGLAKTDEAGDLTGSHDILGTIRYMSPERFAGDPTDARADIYSLGLTLYEVLTLSPAFAEYDRLRLIHRVGEGDFRRPREVEPDIPRDLETIVLKAAAREPKNRYTSARDLAEDLELFLANRPIKSRRASAWEHLRRWARRNPVVAGLAAMVAALLVAVTVISLASNARLGKTNADLSRTLNDLDANEKALSKAFGEQALLRKEAEDEAWRAHIKATEGGRFSGRRGQRFEGLKNLAAALELKPGQELLTVRNEAVGCLALPDVAVAREFPYPEGSHGAVFSRDLTKYARIDTAGRVTLRRVADDAELFELPHPGTLIHYYGWGFSPDGRYFWHFSNRRKSVWQVDGPRPIEVLDLGRVYLRGKVTGVDFTADNARLAVVDEGATIRLFDVREADPVRRHRPAYEWQLPSDTARGVWAHPTRPDIVLLHGEKRLTVFDVSRNRPVHSRLVPDAAGVSWAAWHPDGSAYAVAGEHVRRLYVCSAETETVLATLDGHTTNGILVWFDPAGDRLWSTDWSDQLRLWDWRAGRQMFQVSAAMTIPPTVAADGTLSGVVEGERLQLWRVAVGREANRLAVPAHVPVAASGLIGVPVTSPDGRLLAAPSEDLVTLFDLHRRELVGTVPFPFGMLIRFQADGTGLLLNPHHAALPGLYRIPLARTGSRLQVDSPRMVQPVRRALDVFGLSNDGRVLAVPASGGTDLYGQGGEPVFLGPQSDVRFASVSPDGRRVITGSHGAPGSVTLWDAESGNRVKDLEGSGGHGNFSPDGRWATTFRTDSKKARVWDTTTWQPGPAVAGQRGVFSPDGKYLALAGGAGEVRLVRVPGCEEVVRLTVPDNVRFIPGCFTADGGMFAATAVAAGYVQSWDLHAIRRQLRPLGLDWDDTAIPDWPPGPFRFPARLAVKGPPPEPGKARRLAPVVETVKDPQAAWVIDSVLIAQHPFHPAGYTRRAQDLMALNRFDEAMRDAEAAVRLTPDGSEGYRVRGRVRRATGDPPGALADFRRAADLGPDSAIAQADLAHAAIRLKDYPSFLASARRLTALVPRDELWWQALAVGLLVADPPLRDVAGARVAADEAVRLDPANGNSRTALGCALLEAGDWEDAARQFHESRRLRVHPRYDGLNLFGLAMCARRSGDQAKARAFFADAVATVDYGTFESDAGDRLFRRMYAEAARSLGLPPPPKR